MLRSALITAAWGAAVALGFTGATASSLAKPAARPTVKLSVVASSGSLTVRVTTKPRSTCALKASIRRKSASFPRVLTSKKGRAKFTWTVPKDAPTGTWTFTVSCKKNGTTRQAKTRALIVTNGSGEGALIESSSGKLGDGAELVSDGKGAGSGQSCAPDLNGGTVCFTNNPFATPAYGSNTGECTWYAAGRRPDLYGIARRNANLWPADVAGRVPTGKTPAVGAIAVWASGGGGAGHVAYVTAVTDGGATVVVDEANYARYHTVSYGRRVPASQISSYIYGGPAGNGSGGGGATPPPSDTDGDGLPDAQDHCPAAAGPSGNSGCPLQVTPSQFQSFAGDFNGDNQVDLALRDQKSGMFYFRSGPAFTDQTTFQWDNTTDYQSFAGDFNGDNQVDAGLRNQQSGMFYARYGSGFTDQTAFQWDNSTAYQSFAGDFNGDNQVDFGLRNIQSGMFYARYGPAFTNQTAFQWDNTTAYQSFAGDFNGDNQVDFGLRNIQSGMFYARYGPAFTNQTAFQWDNTTAYQSFAGDFNGDNQVDFGLRNIQSGMFYIRYGPTFTNQTTFQWAPG